MNRRALLLCSAVLLAGCPATEPPPANDDDATEATTSAPWSKGPPAMAAAPTDRRALRVIAHLHSHWSHDACDGNPQPDGVPDEDCYQDLRDGLCTTRIDVAFLSDHPTHADETDYSTLLLHRQGDEAVPNGSGTIVGTRINCEGGHQVLLLPGIESSEMMPLGLDEHMSGYSGTTEAEWDAISDAGGLRWIAHTEGRSLESLAAVGLDGLELYQLHANLAPDIREEFLGLDPFGYLGEVGPFFFPETNEILNPPHPDLAPLGFLVLNEPSIVALETLGLDQVIGVTGGTDAHQNVFPANASDFERIDSYRRMLRWFNNWLWVPEGAAITPELLEERMRSAKAFVVFEVLGTPLGFDVDVRSASGSAGTLGDAIPFGDGLAVHVTPPTLDPRSPRGFDAPEVVTRVYHATAAGRTLVLEQEGDAPAVAELPGPGVARVEIWIRPRHLRPYLGEVADDYADTLIPWIQTGGVFVR